METALQYATSRRKIRGDRTDGSENRYCGKYVSRVEVIVSLTQSPFGKEATDA
jgi:hypothetical protein